MFLKVLRKEPRRVTLLQCLQTSRQVVHGRHQVRYHSHCPVYFSLYELFSILRIFKALSRYTEMVDCHIMGRSDRMDKCRTAHKQATHVRIADLFCLVNYQPQGRFEGRHLEL